MNLGMFLSIRLRMQLTSYSIEYLVNVFGMEREQARKVITSGGSSKSKT